MKMNFVFKQVQKGNLGEDYVKELQKEYKTINDTTRKLKKISNDIKSLSEGQNDKVRDIYQQIESIEDVVYRTNKEVEMFNTKERNKVSHYGWGVLVLIILIVTLIGYIWFKVNYNK
jgi:t-SNARE complex subunit (syntaxin)